MREIVYVAAGGALGSLCRYGIGLAAARLAGRGFPWGTLAVNVAGCFAMGVVLELLSTWEVRPIAVANTVNRLTFLHKAVAVGFLGGLTTFSTFGGDTLRELQQGQTGLALANIAANVLLSLGAVWCGFALMQAMD